MATAIPNVEFSKTFDFGTADDAIAAVGDAGRTVSMYMVPLEDVHPVAGFNIRIHDESYEQQIESLKQSIRDNGFFRHRPLKVFVSKEGDQSLFMLADGYTRWEAAKRAVAEGAKVPRVPIVVVQKGTSLDDLLVGLDADNDSRPLQPYEKGIIVKRLQAAENDEDEIASKLRITKQYVGDLLLLMSAPKALHNMVVNGEVAANLAIDMLKEHGNKKAVEVLKAAGATGETKPKNGKANGAAEPTTRVTRKDVARTGGTTKAGKALYEALIEYLIVKGKEDPKTAYEFLVSWHDKDPAALKELSKVAKPAKAKGKGEKNPKDVRIKITDDMTDEQKAEARAHNKEVKARKERREKRKLAKEAAAAAATGGTTGTADNDPI
jgi:ParB-like chromosome segregation protein Spo0J